MTGQNTQFNMFEHWFDGQKKMFDFWENGVKSMTSIGKKKSEEKPDVSDYLNASMKSIQDLYEQWIGQTTALYQKEMEGFQKTSQEALSKMFGGATLHQDLYKFWIGLSDSVTGKDNDLKAFYDKWNENYMKMMKDYFVSNLPERMQVFFKDPMDVFGIYTNSLKKFSNPWNEELQNLTTLLSKSMTGDANAYIEFNKLWNEKFSETFGKVFRMPEFSMNREQLQKQMSMLNELVSYNSCMNQFVATLVKQNQEAFKDIVKGYQDMVRNGTDPKSFKEFYDYWLKRNEEAYRNLFATDDFSKMVAQVLDAGVNFRKEMDSLMEKQLEFLPFPTKTDMDSLYRTVDSLKREVREHKKELAALKKEKNGKEAANTSTDT